MNENNNGVGAVYRDNAHARAYSERHLIVGDLDEQVASVDCGGIPLFNYSTNQPRGRSFKKE
jgi:hypothetical protein